MAEKTFIDEMFDDAYELQEQKDALMKKIGANRDVLRKMQTLGKLDAQAEKDLAELYPPRTKKDAEDGDDNGDDDNGTPADDDDKQPAKPAPKPAPKQPAKPAPVNA
jgi:hypothetical protein